MKHDLIPQMLTSPTAPSLCGPFTYFVETWPVTGTEAPFDNVNGLTVRLHHTAIEPDYDITIASPAPD